MVKLKKINFCCIGAAKSATTSLFNILKQHSSISVSSFKEPHFFDNSVNYNKGIRWYYDSYFKKAKPNNLLGDFTPTYLSSLDSPKRIQQTLGAKIKFIVILRNPVDRAYSHYLHSKRDEHENLSFIDALSIEDKRLVSSNEINRLRFSYVTQSLYAQHISNYFNYFSKENFHFMIFDDFVNNKKESIIEVCKFLEIPYEECINLNVDSNKASVARSRIIKRFIKKDGFLKRIIKFFLPSIALRQKLRNKVHALNNKQTDKKPLINKDRQYIYKEFFKQEIEVLEKMLNLDLNIWKEC